MTDHQSIITPPPDITTIKNIVDNIPNILRWKTPIYESKSETGEFNLFSEFPQDIQAKILGSRTSISRTLQSNLTMQQNFYDRYCMAAITRKELINYFATIPPKGQVELIAFKLFQNGIEEIKTDVEFYRVNRVNKTYDIHNQTRGLASSLIYPREVMATIEGKNQNYLLLFDPKFTAIILERRYSCIKFNPNYVIDYIRNQIKSFFQYFAPYLFITDQYLIMPGVDTSDTTSTDNYNQYLDNIIEARQNMSRTNNDFVSVDSESQAILYAYYKQFLPQYL